MEKATPSIAWNVPSAPSAHSNMSIKKEDKKKGDRRQKTAKFCQESICETRFKPPRKYNFLRKRRQAFMFQQQGEIPSEGQTIAIVDIFSTADSAQDGQFKAKHCFFIQPRRIDCQSAPHGNPRIQRVGNDRERDIGSGNLDAHSKEVARPSEKELLMRTTRTNLAEKKVQFQGRILAHSKFRD